MSSSASVAARAAAPGTLPQFLLRIPPAALLVLVGFVLFFLIADRLADVFAFLESKGPLGSDTREGAEFMLRLKYEWKHPLAGLVLWATTEPFDLIPGLAQTTALALSLALVATLNLLTAYAVARRLGCDEPTAVLATACFALLLTSLVGLSLTDTYTVSTLTALLVIYAWLADPAPLGWGPSLRLGGIIGVACLSNPPLVLMAALPAMHAWLTGSFRQAVVTGLRVGVTAVLLVLMVALTHATLKHGTPLAYFERSASYTDHYGEAARLLEPDLYADVASAFLAFSVAAPDPEIPSGHLDTDHLEGYLAGPGGLLALAGVLLVTALALAAMLGRHRDLAVPIAVWLLATIVFYTYFHPPAAMLYTVQTRPAFLVFVALGALALPSRRLRVAALLALAFLLGARNLPIVLTGPFGFELKTSALF